MVIAVKKKVIIYFSSHIFKHNELTSKSPSMTLTVTSRPVLMCARGGVNNVRRDVAPTPIANILETTISSPLLDMRVWTCRANVYLPATSLLYSVIS